MTAVVPETVTAYPNSPEPVSSDATSKACCDHDEPDPVNTYTAFRLEEPTRAVGPETSTAPPNRAPAVASDAVSLALCNDEPNAGRAAAMVLEEPATSVGARGAVSRPTPNASVDTTSTAPRAIASTDMRMAPASPARRSRRRQHPAGPVSSQCRVDTSHPSEEMRSTRRSRNAFASTST